MPAQATVASTTFYGKGDTAPYRAWLLTDDYGQPIDLTDYTVYIVIAHQSYSYYYSPKERIVDRALCVNDPDQTADGNRGITWWRPETGDLDIAGPFLGQFILVDSGGREETIPPDSYISFFVRDRAGGTT